MTAGNSARSDKRDEDPFYRRERMAGGPFEPFVKHDGFYVVPCEAPYSLAFGGTVFPMNGELPFWGPQCSVMYRVYWDNPSVASQIS